MESQVLNLGKVATELMCLTMFQSVPSTIPEQAEKAMALTSGWDPEGPAADLKPQSYTWQETQSPNSQRWTPCTPHQTPGERAWSFCSHPKSSTQAVPWLRCQFEAQFACRLHIT